MDKEAIKTQLTRAELSDVQSDALADILADVATKGDLRELRSELKLDLQEFKREVDGRLATFQREMEGRFHAFQREIDGRLNSFQSAVSRQLATMDNKIDGFDTKLERQSRKATISIIGYMTFLAAVLGVVITLTG